MNWNMFCRPTLFCAKWFLEDRERTCETDVVRGHCRLHLNVKGRLVVCGSFNDTDELPLSFNVRLNSTKSSTMDKNDHGERDFACYSVGN
jgi:hypothetical protein